MRAHIADAGVDAMPFSDFDSQSPLGPAPLGTAAPGWKLLIVDDEPDVHALTKLLLRHFVYRDRGIEFLSALNAADARTLLRNNPDIALVLLDVVMETEHAGIELVNFIRHELGNKSLQIVIRTGQPGSAPPLQLVMEHGINDYKEKTELTQQSILLTVAKSLRLYEDQLALAESARKYDMLADRVREGVDDRELLRLLRAEWDQISQAVSRDGTPADPRLSSLTDREREVLKWLAQGDSNKAIGIRLGVQEVTVKAHLRQIFAKLQVFNRTQAAGLALRLHDLDPP
jgi:DNA-binding NarL/FixJ family response regulator